MDSWVATPSEEPFLLLLSLPILQALKSQHKTRAHAFTRSHVAHTPSPASSHSSTREYEEPRGEKAEPDKLFRYVWGMRTMWFHLSYPGRDTKSKPVFFPFDMWKAAEEAHMNDNAARVNAIWLIAGCIVPAGPLCYLPPFFSYYQCIFIAGGIGKM